MSFFVEHGPSDKEVIDIIKRKYGEQANIVSRREYTQGGMLGLFGKKMVELTGYSNQQLRTRDSTKDLDQQKKLLLRALQKKEDPSLQDVVKELKLLREDIQQQREPHEGNGNDNEATFRMREILEKNECSPQFIAHIIEKIKTSLTLEELSHTETIELCTLRWIAESIGSVELTIRRKPQIIILVGPTGVGKTTTIAKLAAWYGITKEPAKRVRMLTIDNYRIGASEQIQTYGDIMNIPVQSVESREELEKRVHRFRDADMIFVDTIGKSPRDYAHLGEMRAMLSDYCEQAMVMLCISATTKFSDAMHIIEQYSTFNVDALIVTKMDETDHIGSILSFAYESRKPISFIATGQRVPSDLERMNILPFLLRMNGFSLQNEKIRSTFGMKTENETEKHR